MPNPEEEFRGAKGSDREIEEAREQHTTLEEIKAQELAETGGRAQENPIAEMLDEGQPAGHPGGQLRGDQTEGHRGGVQRQTLNRGRD